MRMCHERLERLRSRGDKIRAFITHGLPLVRHMEKCPHWDREAWEDGRYEKVDDDPWHYLSTPNNARLFGYFCENLYVVDQFLLWDFVLMDPTSQTVCAREDTEVCWQPSILVRTNICVSNPAGMRPSIIRRAHPEHTQS